MPTPDEARELIRRGYADRLARYEPRGDDKHAFVAPAPASHDGTVLRSTNSGACTFFREGLCELHDLGLKPLEGRLALHSRPWPDVRRTVYLRWTGKRYDSVCNMLHRTSTRPLVAGH